MVSLREPVIGARGLRGLRTEVESRVGLRLRLAVWAALLALVAGSLASGLSGPTPAAADTRPAAGQPATVSSDPLPTAQIDGVAWTQLIVGDTVYVGGSFSAARAAGADPSTAVTRTNFLAYKLSTGELVDTFTPAFNAEVKAIAAAPDGKTLYVGGNFTAVNGANRYRIAAFNLETGALKTSFAAGTNAPVQALAVTETTVYAAGTFSSMNSATRVNVAAVNATTGATLPFAVTPSSGSYVRALAVSPDRTKVVLGGNFTSMNGSTNPGYGLAMVNADTGATLPLPVNALLRNGGTLSAIFTLVGTADGFYGSGYSQSRAQGNVEGSFRADWDGKLVWYEDCHGDTYSIAPVGDAVYVAGHPHYCSGVGGFPQTQKWTYHRALAFSNAATGVLATDSQNYYNYAGTPAPTALNFYPDINAGTYTTQGQGPWHVTGNADYVIYGGEFTEVNGKPQQGLVRFARTALAPNADGPRLGGAGQGLTARSYADNTVRLSWPANWDRDNTKITYKLFRDNVAISTTTGESTFWIRPNLSFLDRGLTAGQSYTYRLKATDPFGNTQWSDFVSATPSGGKALTRYKSMVLGDGPTAYWPFDETAGSSAADWSGTDTVTAGSRVSTGVPGAIAGESPTAFRLSGASTSQLGDPVSYYAPDNLSLEAWFKTSSRSGGQIIGFDKSAGGGNTVSDRHIYLSNDGRVFFAAKPNNVVKAVSSTASYNNGGWHHVVGTLGRDGMRLYVDGTQVGYGADTKSGYSTLGYFRMGGAVLTNLPSQPSSRYLAGDLDEVAVYPAPLSAEQVYNHYNLGANATAPNVAPQAGFTHTESALKVDLDGAPSVDSDGTVASYAWDFGDGATDTGKTTSHTYATPGTYPVTLTVTDNQGKVSQPAQQSVTVAEAPNVKPAAGFSATQSDLQVSVDGGASTDSDGSVAGYAWDFGDGSTDTGVTASHTYASAGSYVVKLTVTDDDGATDTTSKAISAPAGSEPFVFDDFDRTQASGLGSAQTGGAWTTSAANGFTVDGANGIWKLTGAGTNRTAYLGAATKDSADVRMSVSTDKAATGGGIYLTVQGRRVSATEDYRLNLKLTSTNKVSVSLGALQGSATAVNLTSAVTLPDLYTAGTDLNVRLQTFGTSPTTIRAKVWPVGTSEPDAWTVSVTDSYAGLQVPGAIGFGAYASGSSTGVPVNVAVRKLTAVPVTS